MGVKVTFSEFENKIKNKFGDDVDLSLIDSENFHYSDKQKFICKIHNEPFETFPKLLLRSTHICSKCRTEYLSKRAHVLHGKQKNLISVQEFKHTISEKFNNNISINEETIRSTKDNNIIKTSTVECICKKHGKFLSTPLNLLRSVHGCKKCAIEYSAEQNILHGVNRRKTFIEKAKTIHGNQYDYSLVDITGKLSKVKIICPKHGIFEQYPQEHLKGKGCNLCNVDKLNCERRIGEILKNKFPDLEIIQQYHGCLGRQSLDYYIPKYKIGIEYQGSQHFTDNSYLDDNRHSLDRRIMLDNIKYDKCKNANIKIFYFTFDKKYKNINYFDKLYVDVNEFLSSIDHYINNYIHVYESNMS